MKNVENNSPSDKVKPDQRSDQDKESMAQSDRPWEKNPQNTTDPSLPDAAKPDLEKWRRTKTH